MLTNTCRKYAKKYFFSGNQLFIEGNVNFHNIVETKFSEQRAFFIKWKLSCYDTDEENMLERKVSEHKWFFMNETRKLP